MGYKSENLWNWEGFRAVIDPHKQKEKIQHKRFLSLLRKLWDKFKDLLKV